MANQTISYEEAFGLTSPPAQAGTVSYEDAFGLPPAPPKRRTLAAIANDTVIEAANAAAGGVSAAANFVRPGNAVSGWIDKNIVQAGEASQSDATRAEKQRFRQDVANSQGVMDELGAVGRYVVNNPVLAAAQAVGSFAGPGAAVKGGRTLASIAGLNAARGGLAGGAAAGAAMAGGDAAGTAYELSTKAGATDEQALAAGRQASVLPAIIGGAGGLVGAERLVAGAKGFTGNAVSRAVKTAAVEGAQEGIEEGVTEYEGQRAAMPFDKTIDPMKGVAAAAGMGAALGAGTGGGVSLLTGGHGAEGAPVEQSQQTTALDQKSPAAIETVAAPAIDPNAGPLSKAASMAGDLGLAPVPAAPTAEEQRAQLEATISRLPEDQQREARVELADADNQALPAGVRALRSERVQELADAAPAAEVDLAPQDMERGRVVQNFDARAPELPPVADYAPLIDEMVLPERRAEFRDLLVKATDTAFSPAERAAAAEVLHATFSPDQLQRARTARPTPDTRLDLQDTAPARFGNEIDFDQRPSTTPAPDAMAERINQLALDADLTPGAPLQLNQAHALRRRAADQGITISVIPHPSGRGYDVAPTARLDSAARAAMPQDEAAAQLPYDQSATGRMVAAPDGGVRTETRPEAVARSNAAAAQRQQVEAERQRRAELGLSNITPVTPVREGGSVSRPPLTFDNAPTGRLVAGADGVRQERRAEVVNRANAPAPAPQTVTSASGAPFATWQAAQRELQRQQLGSTHEVAPAGGDESLGFVLREKGGNQPAPLDGKAQAATNSLAERAPNWRTNAMQANRVARGLGIETKGKRLAQVLAEIDAADTAGRHRANGPYPASAATRTPDGDWLPATKTGDGIGRAINGAPAFSDASTASAWAGYEQAKSRDGADVAALEQLQNSLASRMSSRGVATSEPTTTVSAPEMVAADADASSGSSPSTTQQGAGHQQDRPPRAGPRPETHKNQAPTLDQQAQAAIESGADSTAAGPRPARAAAPQSTTRNEDLGTQRQEGDGPATLFSSSDQAAPARGLSLEETQQAVQQALAGLANPPPVDVVSRSEELGVGAPNGVMGAAVPGEGRIVIVASAHGSADAVVETVFHEMFHLGVRNVLPAPDYVQSMLDLAKRDSRVQEYANKWKREAPDAPEQLQALRDRGLKGSELQAQYEALAVEEGLAVVAEELRAEKQAGTRMGLRVRTLANWLAGVAERMGMQSLADRVRKMTYNQAERFVLRAIEHAGARPGAPGGVRFRAVEQTQTPAFQRWFGESKAVDGDGQPLRVFHGTGGDFNVFSRARAGATTGAANTGMGFFFTDNPDVAGNYARMSRDAQSIMPAYLSVQNPLRLEAKNMMEADRLLLSGLKPENDGAIIRVAMRDGGTQTVYMVRESGQVKSATGNRGTFDPSNEDIRFRAKDETPTAERMGNALKSVTVANLKQQAGYKAADYRGLGLQLLGRRQLVDVYGGMLPELRRYSDLMARMDADKNEAGSGADQLAQDWAKLPDERVLAELMHDSTLAQIDPSRDFVDGDNKTDWTRLQARYNALTPEAKDVYARARDTYRQHMRDVRSAIKERIERTEISSERKAAMLKRMDDEFFGHIKGVYFPLARFGQYVVVVKDAEGKVANVSRAETMAEADATRRQLVGAFPAGKGFTVGKVLKAKDFVAERDSVGRGFMEQLYGVLDKQGMDTKQRAELEDALGQLYLSSLPDLSWAKHGIHRKGTAGFSQDARRAFAQNVFHGASYLAKLRYGDRLQDELGEMQRRVDAGSTDSNFDSVKGQQVVDEMVKRHDAAMNPKTNAVSTALTSLGFMFHLGLSPASAMVNLTQTALVAYPVMGAKWGFKKASAALLKASGEAARGKNDITSSLSADEKAAFDEAVRHGVIDVTMAHDLAGIAQGEDQNVSYKLRPAMRAASWLFHHAEKFNRQVTFVAAYRLAREAGAGEKAAFEQAVQATYDGHFDYSANNRPRAMQGNVTRVVLLFKQYGQNMVYTLLRNAHQSLKGATPQERAQARKALGGLLTMHGLAAGALGLPMVTTLLAAASMLGGSDDEPWDAQVALQNMLADTFGQKPAEVLSHGLSRLTPWDISGRVGLDKLIFPDVQEGLEGQRLAESAMSAALGPVAGIGVNALKGVQLMGEGQYQRGLEAMAPSVLRGPLKSLRYGSEGVRDKSGIVVQDEVGAAALLGQVAGFSPSEVRNAYEGKSAIVQHDHALQARRSALVEQFAMAAMAGDEEGKAAAREDIAKFNEKNPNRRIQAMQLAQSVNTRQKRIREAQEGVYLPSKRRADAMEAGRFAVPE